MRAKEHSKAVPFLLRALERDPDSAPLWTALGLARAKTGDRTEALVCFERSLAAEPDNLPALNLAGLLLCRLRDYGRARRLFERAAETAPKSPEPLYNLGLLCLALKDNSGALEFFKKALDLNPLHRGALLNAGALLAGARDPAAADCLGKALLMTGAKLSGEGGNFGMDASLRSQSGLAAGDPAALQELAAAFMAAGKISDGIAACRRAVDAGPDNSAAHVVLGTALLTAGDFENGWREYEWRIKAGYLRRFNIPSGKEQWDGSRMDGGKLLVICEQGCGDALQFIRYAPMIKERSGAEITLLCRRSMAALFENSMPGLLTVVSGTPPESGFDRWVSLMSAPFLFGTAPDSVPPAPYLRAAEKDRVRWERKASALKGKKIGLSWAGSPLHESDRLRSLRFDALKPLFKVKGVSFVSLQRLCAPAPEESAGISNFHDWSAGLNDFADTAALVSCLDLVISVDTAVAHLSGALGQKTWTLIPFVPEWRWMRDTDKSPWYPSMRLVRQTKFNDWPAVINRLAEEIKGL
jgi:tetratricopeptide (TPR) repeat protein